MDFFGDKAIEGMRELGHPLCVGLDPYLDRIPRAFRRGAMDPQQEETALAVEEFCCRTIDLIAGDVAIIKPQASLFERLGWLGWRVLKRVTGYALRARLLVLLDAKRGDIADTARGYAQAYLGVDAACAVDAMTVNPYLGPASVEPFMVEAERSGRGVIVLVRNSNLDSSKYQCVTSSGGPYFKIVAESMAQWQSPLTGGRTGWSSLGVTVAATHAQDTEIIRGVLPKALFLVLGYGAQGASAKDAVRGFCRGPKGLEGGMVSSSRPILFPEGACEAGAKEWEMGVRAALAKASAELGEAVR
jgi:orotidine-5'-phosphate decarboxylase